MKISLPVSRAALAACILSASLSARAAVYNWVNNTGGNWSDAANWNPSQIPGPNDTAVITATGNYTVVLDESASVAGLTLGAPTAGTVQTFLTGNQTITVNGPIQVTPQGQFNLNGGAIAGTSVLSGIITWSGGSMSGALTLSNSGVLNIVPGGGNGFRGLIMTNYGTVNWANTTIYSTPPNNAQIYNYGTWNARSGNQFLGGYGGGTTLFENIGSLVVSNGGTSSLLDGNVIFNNTGAVVVNGGALSLNGGGTNNGAVLTTTNGGTLNFSGAVFLNTNSFTGEGNYITGGTTFGGTIDGTLNWNGGSISGVMTLASNTVFSIVSGGGNGLNGLILTNLGTVNWSNTTIYSYGPNNAQIYNHGTWNAQSDSQFFGGYGGGTTLFENYGNFVKSLGTATSTLDANVSFNNTGKVSVQSAMLDIGAGTSSGGRFLTSSGASLNFITTPYNFNGTNTLNGSGAFLNEGANFNGTIDGTLAWNGGSLEGAMTLANGGVFNIVPGAGNGLKGFILTNYGVVNWTNATIYSYGPNNAQIYNYGTWTAQSDNQFFGGYGGGSTLFENFGMFLKSGNAGTTTLDPNVVFNNSGTVSSASGTLDIQGGGTNNGTGTFTTTGSGALGLFGINFANNATINSTNVVDIGGNSTINGVLTAPNLQLVGGTLSGGLSGTNVLIGELTWSGGNLSGALTLATNSVLNIVQGGGNGMMGLRLTNYGTVNWTNTTIYSYGPNNAQIYNYGAWNAQSGNQFLGGYSGGTTVFENFGSFVCSGTNGVAVLDANVIFTNTGTIAADNGTLSLNGGGSSSGGAIVTTNGGTISFSGMVFTNTNSFSGIGSYVSGGATFGGTVEGTLNWDGGAINGVMTLAGNAIFNIEAGGGNGLKGLVLTNLGTVNWTNTTIYSYGTNNAQIYNYGTWNAQSDNQFLGGYGGGTTLFDNLGTVVKSPGTGTTSFDANVTFNNSGRVSVQSGALTIGAGTGNSGRFSTAGIASLSFISDAYDFDGTNTFTGAGAFVSGGATFDGTIKGTLTWNGGSLSGEMTLATNSIFNIVAGGGNGLKGLVLTNLGTVNWTNTTIYSYGANNAQIYNYGVWDAQSDNQFLGGYGGGTTLFDNFGAFLKSGNTGTTILDANTVFDNSGEVNVASGTLDIQGGGINRPRGTFVTADGATLVVDNMTFPNGATFNSGATVQLGGTTTVNGVLTATDLDFSSGTLSGTNTLVGTMTWSGGSLSGVMTVASNSVLNIVQGGGNGFNGFLLTNYGTVNWTNTSIYSLTTNNTSIYNYGLWDAQSDNAFFGGAGGGISLFDNFGTFRKSGNTGTTELNASVVFNNIGTVEAQSGTISLGQDTSLEAGTLNFSINSQTNFGTIELASGAVLSGALSVDFNNGFLPASGTEFPLLSGANLSGSLSTGSLPFGMSFAYSKTNVSLVWNGITQADWAAGTSVLYGTTTLTFLESPGFTVQLVASGKAGTFVLGATTSGGLGTISFNASQLPNGIYNFQAVIVNAGGQVVGDYGRQAFVNNSLSWHDGILSGNQTWGTNSVNAVDQNVIIPSGVTLTLAPGAIVKFAQGTGIIIEAGGVLDASGATTNNPIILTSIEDDSVGGDSNEDGNNTVPEPGDWNGILSSGKYLASSFVQTRYVLQTHSGVLSQSQEWSGPQEHFVTGNVIVPAGVTLTIGPGAIIKMGLGLNITVQSGGTFIANGTVAQPIVITSINDTSVGTSMNGVAAPPAAGDWDSIYLAGGNGTFTHVSLSYGGGPDSLNSGLISITGAGSVVNVTDCFLSQALYRGIEAEYGNVNVTNCVVTGCDRGIQSGLSGPTTVNVINCTLDNNNYALFAHGGIMNVANSIIADSLTAGLAYCCGSSLTTFDHNDVWSATGAYASSTWPVANQTGIKGNISENPNFVNAAQGNFELNFGSPCIDAADSIVALATDLTGAPRYNDAGTPIKGGIPNASGTYADMGAFEFVQTASSPVDLIASSVNGPATETAGQTVTVQWTDANIGTASATGPWHDSISLVPADGSAPLVAATVLVAQNIVLGPGQTYPASVSVVVPGGNPGTYQWQVQVNSGGDVFEGVNWTNNTTLASTTTFLQDPALTIAGSPMTNHFTAAGQSNVFAVASPGSAFVLTAQASAPGCGLKVFVGDGYVPSTSSFDFQSSQFDSPTATVTVPGNNHDTYYVLVYVVSLNVASVNYTLTATPVGFGLSSVSPTSIVNSGPVTLQVSGDDLADSDLYRLAGPGGTFAASTVQSSDPTLAYATFNLGGAAAGYYNLVVAQPAGQILTLSNAVLVTTAPGSATNTSASTFSVQLELPTAFRASRAFAGSVVYGDTGDVDMPAPILILSSGGTAGLALQGSTNYSTSDLLLVAVSFQGPAGTLTPGQSWTIGFSAFSANEGTIPFEVDYELANSTNVVNYSALGTSLRPPGYSDADWNNIWNGFQSEAGPTWGGFVSLVDSYATEMALDSSTNQFYVLADVLGYAFAEKLAQAETSVTGTLYLGDTNHPLAQAYLSLSSPSNVVATTQSLADGTFRFLTVPGGSYSVDVLDYFQPVPLQITVPNSGTLSGLHVVVSQGATIQGNVLNQFGSLSLTNATVQAVSTTTGGYFAATVGANGTFLLNGLPPDTYNVSAGGGLYGTQTFLMTLSDGEVFDTNFVLAPAASVQGQVTGNGQPLTNALAFFSDASSNVTPAPSDANGDFTVTGLSAGAYTVTVQAPGFQDYNTSLSLLAGGQTNLGVIEMIAGATVAVSLDTSGGQPTTNAILALMQNGVILTEQLVASNGFAYFTGLADGTYVVEGGSYGFQTTSNTVTVANGVGVTNSYALTALASIVGTVTDGAHNPIEGIDVNFYGTNNLGQDISFSVQTDTKGNYSLLGIPQGTFVVSVGNGGGVDNQAVTIPVSLGQRTVNFDLSGSVIQGQVLAADGATPVTDGTVYLSLSNQPVATALTDSNGNYLFRVVMPGSFTVAAGSDAGISSNQTVTLSASANVLASPLIIGSLQFGGMVTNTSGQPLTNASVFLLPAGALAAQQPFISGSSANGTFSMSGLVPGQYTVLIKQEGYTRLQDTVTIPEDLFSGFGLTAGLAVSGTITDATSHLPVGNAVVNVVVPGTGFLVRITSSDASGAFTADDLSLGTYNFLITETNHQDLELPGVEVGANSPALNASLNPTNTVVHGTVVDSGNNPVPGATIAIADTNTSLVLAQLMSADDGTWSTAQLPPGTYTLQSEALGYLSPPQAQFAVKAQGAVSLTVTLLPVATDDNKNNYINTTPDGPFAALAQALGEGLAKLKHNEEPNCVTVFSPSGQIECPDCNGHIEFPAEEQFNEAYKFANLANAACEYWNEQYKAGLLVTGADAGILAVKSAKLASSLAALGEYEGLQTVETGIKSMTDAEQKGILACQCIKTAADLPQLLGPVTEGIGNVIQSIREGDSEEALRNINELVNPASVLGENVSKTLEVLNELKEVEGVALPPWVGPLAEFFEAAESVHELYEDYEAALGPVEQAADAYLDNLHEFNSAMRAFNLANHCPPMPPCPPLPVPPKPIPGPKQPLNSVQSGDPNDKFATGIGLPGWVPEGTAITYTIDFENEATASAPAQQVTIIDPLSASLDWSTLQLTAIAFNNMVINIPAGVQTFSTNASVSTDPNPVSVSASLNPTTGILSWVIESINPVTGQLVTDPLAGFLPPDNSQQQGEGYVVYTVKPRSGLASGTPITNKASIVFDVNAAIATPTTTNFIGSGAPLITTQPQPVTTNLGGTAVFSVSAAGTAPYLYQWSKDGKTMDGATASVLVLGNVQVSDVGNYTVSVSAGSASTNSVAAALTVTTNSSLNQIEIVISGKGSVSPPDNGKALQIGHTYTLIATPGSGYLFANWSGFVFTNTASLKFVMQNNMLLEANFVPNIFLASHGTYTGLFAPTDANREQTNSGAFNFNLQTTGSFSGQLQLGAQTIPLTGKFGVTGAAAIQSSRKGQNPLTTTLQLDLANQAVEGTVTDGSFVATLQGNQSVFSAAQPAKAYEGPYTLIITGQSNPDIGPFGVSYGILKVTPTGTITLTGSLADGTPISQSSAVSKNGFWPLYLNLYGGKGSLWGWNQFVNHVVGSVPSVSWINATNSNKAAVYRSGFTNQQATLAGSYYLPTARPPLDLATGQVVLETANPPLTLMNEITLTANGAIVAATNAGDINGLTLKITPTTGIVSGSYKNPANPKQIIKINGVLLQGATNVAGYFLGTNQSGSFILSPP